MLRAVSVLALGALLALAPVAVAPASAALPPGDFNTWSVPPTSPSLAYCSSVTSGSLVSVGGYDRRDVVGFEFDNSSLVPGSPTPSTVIPITVRLGEPCIDSTNTLGFAFVVSGALSASPPESRYAYLGVNVTKLECRTSGGSYAERTGLFVSRRVVGPSATGLTAEQRYVMTEAGSANRTWLTNNCGRLIAIEGNVQRIVGGSPQSIPFRWSAARFLGNEEYELIADDPDLLTWCQENPTALQCAPYLTPDPGTWEDTCGDPNQAEHYGVEYATFNPVDAATWGPAAAWLFACLFVPLPEGGFDRDGAVAAAWANSPNAEAGIALVNLANTWTFASNCGPLISAPADGPLGAFTVDTCTWTWAEPGRAVLGLGVLALGLWWFLTYCVRAVTGVIRKNVPSPVEESASA